MPVLRIVLLVAAVFAALYLLVRLSKELSRADVDWRGVAFAAGYVALAFYLNHATGVGGIG